MQNTLKLSAALFVFSLVLTVVGCSSNTGMVEVPPNAAELEAEAQARQAEYSKSMQEAYGKK